MNGGHPFCELVAVESDVARRNVLTFAQKLHADQLRIWVSNRDAGRPNKPRPPTWAECLAKSVQIRTKRERDSRYFNDLVSARPIH